VTSKANMNINVAVNDRATKKLKNMESTVIRVVGAMSAAFAAGAVIVFPVKAAAEFERQMKDVQKTTGFTDESIKGLSTSLLNLSRTIGIAAKELGVIAAIAGQLGLGDFGRSAIESFTKSVAIATVTLGLTSQELAEFGSQATAIFNIGPDEVGRVFDVMNALSNNTVANAKDLLDITKRIGPVASDQITEVLALAAATKQLGNTNEVGATFYVKLFPRFLVNAQKFADVLGVTKGYWQDIIATKGNMEALRIISTKISRLPKSEQIGQMINLAGAGSRSLSVFAKQVNDAGNSVTQLDRALAIGRKAYKEATSSADEYATITKSVVQQLLIAKGAFGALAIDAGSEALKTLQKHIVRIINALNDPALQDFFIGFGKNINVVVDSLGEAVSALVKFTAVWRSLGYVIAGVIGYNVSTWIISMSVALTLSVLRPIIRLVKRIFTLFIFMGFSARLAFAMIVQGAVATTVAMTRVTTAVDSATGSIIAYTAASKAAILKVTRFGKVAGFLARFAVAFTVIGVILASVGSIIYDNWNTIKKMFGFMSTKTRILERRARVAQKAYENKIQKSKDAVRELNDQIRNGRVPTSEDPFGEFTSGKEQITILKEMTAEIAKYGQAMEGLQDMIKEDEDRQSGLQKEYNKTEKAFVRLANRYKKLKSYKYAGAPYFIEVGNIEEELGTLGDRLSTLKESMDGVAESTANAKENMDEYVQLILDAFGGTISKTMGSTTLDYVKFKQAALEAFEAQEKIIKEIDQYRNLAGIPVDGGLVDPNNKRDLENETETLGVLNDRWSKLNDNYRAASDNLNKYLNRGDQFKPERVSNINPTQQKLIDKLIGSMDAAKIKQFSIALKAAMEAQKGLNISGVNIIETYKKSASALEIEKVALAQAVAKQKELTSVTLAYKKSAISAYNNVGNELVALRDNLQDFLVDFDQGLKDRELTISGEKARKELSDSLEEEKDLLRKQAKEKIKIRGEGSRKAVEAELKEQLKLLEGDNLNEISTLRRNELEEKLVANRKRSLQLLKDVDAATQKGEVDRARALRKDSKEEFKSRQGLLNELKDLRRINYAGESEFLIPKEEFEQLKKDYLAFDKELEAGLSSTAETIKTAAIKQAEDFTTVLTYLETKLENVLEKLKELSNYLSNINYRGEQLEKAFPKFITKEDVVDIDAYREAVKRLTKAEADRDAGLKGGKKTRDAHRAIGTPDNITNNPWIPSKEKIEAFKSTTSKTVSDGIKDGVEDGFKRATDTYELNVDINGDEIDNDIKKAINSGLNTSVGAEKVPVTVDISLVGDDLTTLKNLEDNRKINATIVASIDNKDKGLLSGLLDFVLSPASADTTIPVKILPELLDNEGKDLVKKLQLAFAADPIDIEIANTFKYIQELINRDPPKVIVDLTPDDTAVLEGVRNLEESPDSKITIGLTIDPLDAKRRADAALRTFNDFEFPVELKVKGPQGKDFYTQGREAGTQYGQAFGDSALDRFTKWHDALIAAGGANAKDYSDVFNAKFKEEFKLDFDSINANANNYSKVFNAKLKEELKIDFDSNNAYEYAKSVAGAIEAANLKLPVELEPDPVQIQTGIDALGVMDIKLRGIITSVVGADGKVTNTGDNIVGYSSGGQVSGPGSSTSDSIPAWLSNGEFVMDAITTRFFGGSFFSGLQALAKTGRRPKMKGGLPAFAGGGLVGGGSGKVGNVTTLNITLNGKESTLYGAADAVETFVDVMNGLEKGIA